MKRRTSLLVIAVVVVTVVATTFAAVHVVKPSPPIPLTVSDGSTTGTMEGDLTNISSGNPLALNVSATTYANQTGHPSSTLIMVVQTYYYYVAASPGFLDINIAVEVLGRFASNLRPSGLQLAGHATGGYGDSLYFWPGNQTGTNVSFDRNQYFGVFPGASNGTGSGQASATPMNEGGGTYYDFAYGAGFEAFEYLSHGESVGFRVTMTGPFTPPVSVEIVLAVIDVPA